ncbi:MAG TPA: hypothetical protein VHW65_05995, partial [Gemmatimonadales bacterium]|nr:hypothetical protein [Gemmatimonadales bacterium]
NQDIVYVIMTFYNITSTRASDYSAARPSMQPILQQKASDFQSLNNAHFFATTPGVALPTLGYTMAQLYAVWGSDEDVGDANSDYSSVNLPFALMYAYESKFSSGTTGWTFDPAVFGAPFFPGVGFIGFKYLQGPDGLQPAHIELFTNSTNRNPVTGANPLPDPNGSQRTFRIFAGVPTSADGACNQTLAAGQLTTDIHICYVQLAAPQDIRSYASSVPLTLAPGASASVVVAAIYAAPVALPGFTPNINTNIDPGNATWTEFADSMFAHNASGHPGVNKVDSLSGFVSYTGGQLNLDGSKHSPVQGDFQVQKGSLLDKANVAQNVFNHHFLLPFAPDPPTFFLIPGEAQVTILWKPSASETTGDAFFAIASSPTSTNPDGTIGPNALYDPNYRKFDVEGYRIFRGRTDSPSQLQLLAQFDYAGTVFNDYRGYVEQADFPNCAPELGLTGTTNCPANFTLAVPATGGVVSYPISGQIVQIIPGGRTLLATGAPFVLSADTAITGGNSGFPAPSDTGVPFIFTDKAGACGVCGPVDGITYYYSVTAFDFNSFLSGPSSLSSAPVTESVQVGPAASNFSSTAKLTSTVQGRHGDLTDATPPTLDPTTGEFSKKSLPGNSLSLVVTSFATQVLSGTGTATMRFDSTVTLTESNATGGANNIIDYFTVTNQAGTVTHVSVPLTQSATATSGTVGGSGAFVAFNASATAAAAYGGGSGYTLPGSWTWSRPWMYITGVQERGCANAGLGAPTTAVANTCYFNGPRWFSGSNESTPNPLANMVGAGLAANAAATGTATGLTSGGLVIAGLRTDSAYVGPKAPVNYNVGGTLPGVSVIYMPSGYGELTSTTWRDQDYLGSQYTTSADYNLYWGSAGKIDSVVDVTHDQLVPFGTRALNSWGVLNSTTVAGPGSEDLRGTVLTAEDLNCISPYRSFANTSTGCTQAADSLTNTAVPGQIAFFLGAPTNSQATSFVVPAIGSAPIPTAPVEANAGFGLYLKGHFFMFELTGGAVPSAGTVWTMRDYSGGVYGGNGKATDMQFGPYVYYPPPVRQLNAPNAAVALTYSAVANVANATDQTALAKVHTVPDPYYVTSPFDASTISKSIHFVNVPIGATIRIYTSSDVLVRVITNTSTSNAGTVEWDVRNRSNQFVASGVYFYSVEASGQHRTGRMTIVNLATNAQ